MILKDMVDKVLVDQKRSFSWLAVEMDKTVDGLKLSLVKGSIKYNDILRLVEVLDVPVTMFFAPNYTRETIGTSFAEPIVIYKKREELMQEQINLLKSTIEDKNKIIELLSRK